MTSRFTGHCQAVLARLVLTQGPGRGLEGQGGVPTVAGLLQVVESRPAAQTGATDALRVTPKDENGVNSSHDVHERLQEQGSRSGACVARRVSCRKTSTVY